MVMTISYIFYVILKCDRCNILASFHAPSLSLGSQLSLFVSRFYFKSENKYKKLLRKLFWISSHI